MNLRKLVLSRIVSRGHAMRSSQFELLPIPSGRVVFLGDSIIEYAQWQEWFPQVPVLNRGIAGDTVAGVAARLHTALCEPRAVVLMIGTNDLDGLGVTTDVAGIARQVRDLVERIGKHAPGAGLILTGVTPRTRKFADRIARLNLEYTLIAAEAGAVFIDLCPLLAGPDRAIRPEFSLDGTHLTGDAYRVWADALRPHIQRCWTNE